MLFLGAGASRPMIIDDLSGITLKIKKSVSPILEDTIKQIEGIFKANQYIRGDDLNNNQNDIYALDASASVLRLTSQLLGGYLHICTAVGIFEE